LRLDEDVDVYHLGNGFIVGSTAAGEYLRYTVDVTEDGTQHSDVLCFIQCKI
ncbi:unnamed protein product, partial [Scytosiphon promiscuus]